MKRTIMLIPINDHVGLTSIIISLITVIKEKNLKICFFKPLITCFNNSVTSDYTTDLIRQNLLVDCIDPIILNDKNSFFNDSYISSLIDNIVEQYYLYSDKYDIIIVSGLKSTEIGALSTMLNCKIALALQSKIILVAADRKNFNSYIIENKFLMKYYFNIYENILGIIINKINMIFKKNNINFFNFFINFKKHHILDIYNKLFIENNLFPVLAAIPFNVELMQIPVMDIYIYLNANIFNTGNLYTHNIEGYILYDKFFNSKIKNINKNIILIISIDHFNVLKKTLLQKILNSNIIAILLTEYNEFCNISILDFFIYTNISIISVKSNMLETLLKLYNFKFKIRKNDIIRINKVTCHILKYFNENLLSVINSSSNVPSNISSDLFRLNLIKLSSQCKKCIILPEGYDTRIIHAAAICARKGIANCVLLGNPNIINDIALQENVILKHGITIIDPKNIRNNYIKRLIHLRRHKGMTDIYAQELIKDNVILATLMLEKGEVDGLVSGVINTTANTIRPALQLIKTKENSCLVSSLFFMLLSNQVLVYSDCAINIEPTSKQLADIAIQSADSAKLFGLSPRLAMISYSTKNSGYGISVDKVREATDIVKIKRPDLIIDGPLQYDAATIPYIAIKKSPDSCIAGNANVFIFPDLNTGNTVYKAVQRLTNTIAIGPILQGLKKPINDLSRGAIIEDIVYTIAITAIQSGIKSK